MTNVSRMNNLPSEPLRPFRDRIDAIDREIFELLKKRTAIVQEVAAYKSANEASQSNIRPGREADMLRKVHEAFNNEKFSAAAATHIWRTIIAASTAVETNMAISVYAPENNPLYYWLAREYFGPFIPLHRHPTLGRAIGDVLEKKANAAVLPLPSADEQSPWWLTLADHDKPDLRIFAMVPFVLDGRPGRDPGTALAVGRVTPEPTGNDMTYLCLTTDNSVSTHRLQTVFAKADLNAQWVGIHTSLHDARRHLVLVDGFVNDDHPALLALPPETNGAVTRVQSLGSYAVPISEQNTRNER